MTTPFEQEQPAVKEPHTGDDSGVQRHASRKRKRHRRRAPKSAENFWQFLKQTYATADARSLGLLRIALGTLLFVDVARRWPDVEAFYANTGWLPNHFMLFRPMSGYQFSLYLACSTPGEVKALMLLHMLVCLSFLVGYRTRLMHILAAILLVSINSRNIAIENGGWVVLTLLTIWSCFLPLGRRFSVDALLDSLRARREGTEIALNDRSEPKPDRRPIVSLAVAALVLQWATIYYFNVVHKNGQEWRDGTAVYYFFQQDRMVTTFGAWLRDLMPLWGIKLMTYGALTIESIVAALLIQPFFPKHGRMLAWLLVCSLHLSIDAVVQLGPFSYAMITMFFALIPSDYWELGKARLANRRPETLVRFDPESGFALWVCRVLKRLDAFGRFEFQGDLEAPGIAVEQGDVRASGVEALRVAARSLPVPLLLRAVLALPGPGAILRRGFDDPEWGDSYFEVSETPGTDARAAEPAPWRLRVRRKTRYLREACVALVMVCGVSQVLMENHAVPAWLKPKSRPEWMDAVVVYPRMFQGWSMFAPSPPTDDGRLIVDGITTDGRHFDPLTERAPDFDIAPKGGFHMNQIWGDFQRRIHEERFKPYWNGVRDYIKNHHLLTGRPQDELVAFDVYYVSERIPPPGQPRAKPEKSKLFSYGDTRRPPQQAPR